MTRFGQHFLYNLPVQHVTMSCVTLLLSGIWLRHTEHSAGQRCHKRLWLLQPVPAALSESCGDVCFSLQQHTYCIILTCEHIINIVYLVPVAVLSPDGYLYEKQAILEYILHQKTDIAKKMKVSPAPLSQTTSTLQRLMACVHAGISRLFLYRALSTVENLNGYSAKCQPPLFSLLLLSVVTVTVL